VIEEEMDFGVIMHRSAKPSSRNEANSTVGTIWRKL